MNKCSMPNPTHDVSDVTKAIIKIKDTMEEKIELLLDENDSKAEATLKGYILALRDVKWFLENIDKPTASII